MNFLLLVIYLNRIVSVLCYISCCSSTNQVKLSCKNQELISIPNCTTNNATKHLLLDHNNISTLPNFIFDKFPNLESLRLNNNKIYQIGVNAFGILEYLETLFLNHNLLSTLPKELFQKLKHLKVIYLHHNKFIIIPIIKSTSLQKIHFGNNQINKINFPKEYSMCRNLKGIDLSHNFVKEVLRSDLVGLKNCPIETLKIKNNKLSANQKVDFYFIRKKLRNFVINDNVKLLNAGLKKIFNSFDHIRHSETWHLEIYARNVGLTEVTMDLFESLSKIFLIKLDLTDNFITSIESGFGNLENLRQLDLSRNHISKLLMHQFSGVPYLRQLNLKDNYIDTIHWTAFISLDELTILDLSNNRIEYLDTLAFVNMSSLKHLKLQGNKILTLSMCKVANHLSIVNKFIVDNKLTVDSLCFSPSACEKIIKGNILFGFEVDLSTRFCSVNISEETILELSRDITTGSNETTIVTGYSTVEINSATIEPTNVTVDQILILDSSNISNSTLKETPQKMIFSNLTVQLTISKIVKEDVTMSSVLFILIGAGAIFIVGLVVLFSILFGCRKRYKILQRRFYNKRLKRNKKEIAKKKGTVADNSSNIYESLPDEDIKF